MGAPTDHRDSRCWPPSTWSRLSCSSSRTPTTGSWAGPGARTRWWSPCRAGSRSSSPDARAERVVGVLLGLLSLRRRARGRQGGLAPVAGRGRVGPTTGPGWSRPRPRTPGGCWSLFGLLLLYFPDGRLPSRRWRWVPPVLVVSAASSRRTARSSACRSARRWRTSTGPSARRRPGWRSPASRSSRCSRCSWPAPSRSCSATGAPAATAAAADQVAGAGGHRDAAVPAAVPARDRDLGRGVLGQRAPSGSPPSWPRRSRPASRCCATTCTTSTRRWPSRSPGGC